MNTAPSADRLLKLPQVMDLVALGRDAIYARVRRREFPPPVKLGPRASAWRASEVQEWINSRPRSTAASPNPRASRDQPQLDAAVDPAQCPCRARDARDGRRTRVPEA